MMTTSAPLELPIASKAEPMTGRSPKPKTGVSSPDSSAKVRDSAVTMQLTKTKMCAFFERGKCASANCKYAHSPSELRLPPNLQKTKLCKAFLSGACNNENCSYAHGEAELTVTDGIYKTQICNFFERGYCKKGDRCNHAHGVSDLRSQPSTAASTPMGKTSPSSTGKSSQYRRSPLPLSELLVVDSEANANYFPAHATVPPTPTKSVTELAQMPFSPIHPAPMAFSPAHAAPLWAQYGMQSLSPMGALGCPVNDLASMWPPPRDAVDMLVHDQRMSAGTNLLYAMNMMEPPMHSPSVLTPEKATFNMETPVRPAPGLSPAGTPTALTAEPLSAPPAMAGPPGLEETVKRDPLVFNLSERLANLDAIVQGLGNDVAAIKGDPKRSIRI